MFPFSKKKPMLDEDAQRKIMAAIKEAESATSGEIRVYMEHKCTYMNALHRAQEVFAHLGMDKTEAHNAVIIYVALTDKQFALFGDTAIYEKAGGAHFWDKAAAQLTGHLKNNEIVEGLSNCIRELGTALAAHFPQAAGTKTNELPDEIVFGK